MGRSLCHVSFAMLLACACSKPSEEDSHEAKVWPASPPGSNVKIPAALSIEVIVDGTAKPAITAATLNAAKPDFADDDRKAWRIASLVVDATAPGSVEASSPAGISIRFQHPTAQGFEPVLYLTRRGEVIVAALDPKDPFPNHHGQGGRLSRPGDAMPHVKPVSRLEIKRSTP